MNRQSWISIAALLAAASCRSRPPAPPALPLAGLVAPAEWRGLSEVYRETLVSRSPEVLRFPVSLPANPWLDLHVGTVADEPVTFRVGVLVRPSSQFGEPPVALLLERTLTRGHRWEPAGVDLSAFAGQKVALTLGVEAAAAGTIGLWGSPVVRDRGRPMRAGAPRGVILISVEALRRDHLGAYGYARPASPRIDRLASEGAAFDACFAGAARRKPSSAVLTALDPATRGVQEIDGRRPLSVEGLAAAFRDAGYATVSYASSPAGGRPADLRRGFEEVHEAGSVPSPGSSPTAREYVDRLVPWITAHRDLPFFAFLHLTDPAPPLAPYEAYDASVRAIDAEIGRLMEHLRALRLDGDTLVVLAGDPDGELLGRDAGVNGGSLRGEPLPTPLIFHRPGSIAGGVRVAERVATIDVLPALLVLCGLPAPPGAQDARATPLPEGELDRQ